MQDLTIKEFPLKKETYKIIGAAMEVHKQLGGGFLEAIYQEALEIEFKNNEIDYKRELPLNVIYKGQKLNKQYFADFVCYNSVIVELKALSDISSNHEAQILNYLKATNIQVGLLINFGKQSLQYKRIVNTYYFD